MPSVSWISPPTPRGWLRDLVEHPRRQDVAAGDAEARRARRRAAGFSTIRVMSTSRSPTGVAGDDAVAPGVLRRHFLHGDDRRLLRLELRHHLRQDRRRADHQVVGQQHGERVVADDVAAAQHRVAEAERLRLAHEHAVHVVGLDRVHRRQQLGLVRLLERVLELEGEVEVVLDRPLVPAGDEDHLPDAGGVGLLDGVLDQRLVDDRQHLLRHGLGGRKKARAEAGYRKNRMSD